MTTGMATGMAMAWQRQQGWDGMGAWEINTPPTAAATWTPSNFTKMMALNDNAKKKVILNRRWW